MYSHPTRRVVPPESRREGGADSNGDTPAVIHIVTHDV